MNGPDHAAYRVRLAEGFLIEANQDIIISRWRSATDNSQLAVENAAKAVLALCGVFGRTHQPAPFYDRLSSMAVPEPLIPPKSNVWLN